MDAQHFNVIFKFFKIHVLAPNFWIFGRQLSDNFLRQFTVLTTAARFRQAKIWGVNKSENCIFTDSCKF